MTTFDFYKEYLSMSENKKPGAGTPGNNMKQDKQYLNQLNYNSFYKAELKKFSAKYPYLQVTPK